MQDEKNALIEAVTEKTTDAVKKLVVKGRDSFGLYYVGWDQPGGRLPATLDTSKWTSEVEAQRVCDQYNKG